MITRGRDRVPRARVARVLPLDAAQAWSLVADVRHHTRWVPLTRVDVTRPSTGTTLHGWDRWPDGSAPEVGDEILAVSGPGARRGAPGLVDRMRIERFEAPLGAVPGVAVFTKVGPVILGTARIEVEPLGRGSSHVTWTEAVHLRGLPRGATQLLGALLLDGMLRYAMGQAEREARRIVAQRSAA